ncbi:hypothetical protein KCH_56600 [Kitasatospora cheerisanensis KCTC 2395]|uniref:Uncharacterized protein n=1 Tax=Kitasatospora cheerisanensis KCTC 2395 TaxID=1348663 RepID=A0A066YWX0_9ACTN|nr:hypothetical protein KCH_56600 [Kitasatospora cheerisanensis KCTC 2395]
MPPGAHTQPVPGAPGGNPWAPTGVQQPWGTGGYPPPGAPGAPMYYPAPPRSLYTNNLAIASLIVGIVCCFFGFIGIGLGIGALRQIKRTGERGKGMAVTGIIAGTLGTLMFIGSLVNGDFNSDRFDEDSSSWSSSHGSGGTTSDLPLNSPFRLFSGQCFERGGPGVAKPVACTAQHFGETYWVQDVREKSGAYPGEDVMTAEAEEVCAEHLDSYVADTWAIPEPVITFYYYPDKAGWKFPATRRIVCFLGNEDKSTRTGSLQQRSSSLTSDQRQLLDATNQFDRAWGEGPDEDVEVEDDPQAFRQWATKMSAAATKQAGLLAAADWHTADKATVDRLVVKSRAAAAHFLAASRSTDLATLKRELNAADDNLGNQEIISLRRSLGLATQEEEPAKHNGGSNPV